MKKYLFLVGAAVFGACSAVNAAVNCQTLPSCDELGYGWTAEECAGQKILKCPFDENALYCTNPAGETECQVGSVLYNDKKCYNSTPSGKSAIGVVFDTSKRLALALDYNGGIVGSTQKEDYISGLEPCDAFSGCDLGGKVYSEKIVAFFGTGSDYAAGYCYNKTDGGLAKGSWFLPSTDELGAIFDREFNNLDDAELRLISDGIAKAGGMSLDHGPHWSSTLYRNYPVSFGGYDFGRGQKAGGEASSKIYVARCVVAY